MKTTTFSLGKYAWGIGMAIIALITGGWLMLAPFALGYQPYGASWTQQTTNDFSTGLAVVVISLAGLVLFAASLRRDLRALTPEPVRGKAAAQAVEPTNGAVFESTASRAADLDQAMAALASALAADLVERRREPRDGNNHQSQSSETEPNTRRAA